MKKVMEERQPFRPSWNSWLGGQIVRPRRMHVGVERKLILKILMLVVVYGISATAYIWIHLQSTSMRYALARLNRIHDDLLQRRSELQIEWEMLKAPQRIARIAEQELGLVPPDPHEVIVVK